MLGWRPRDLDLGYLPFLRGKGIAQYTSDPVFRRLIADRAGASSGPRAAASDAGRALRTLVQLARAYPDRFLPALRSGPARAAVQTFIASTRGRR